MKIIHYSEMDPTPVTMNDAKGVTIRWLIAKEDNAPNFAMRLFEIEVSGHTPLHIHNQEHEVFVLEGEGVIWKNGKEVPISSGTAIFVSPNEKHCFKNTGQSIFRFICVVPIEG